jgi:GTPase SAR1 family protein
MITIKRNKHIKLDIPNFLCDENAVGDHLNGHPLLKLLNVYGFLCVIGRPGMGKTSLTISFITQKQPKIYRKTHHHIIILMPSHSIASMKNNPFKQLPEENIIHELNDDTIDGIKSKIEKYASDDEKTLLYIDDMTADLKKTKHIIDVMKSLIYNRRHLKLNIIITAQSFSNIPLDIRKNILEYI